MLDKRIVAGLFVVGAVTTLLILPGGQRPVSDSPARLGVAHWLWTGEAPLQGLATTAPLVLHDRDGNVTPWFGIGQSLVLLPADIAVSAMGLSDPRSRFIAVQYLVFPIINGLVVASAALLLTAIGTGAAVAVAGAVSLTFGSTLLWHFQNNQENPLQFLLLLWALISVFRWQATERSGWLLLAGACLGFTLLIRLPNLVDVLIVSAVPLAGHRRVEYTRTWMRTVAPMLAAALAVDRLYHFARFSRWDSTYMHMSGEVARNLDLALPEGFPFSSPFLTGFLGPFVSLQKSIVLFDPLMLVTIVCLLLAWRSTTPGIRRLALASAAGVVLTAAGYARFHNWGGSPAWGDRFVTNWVWMACLLAAPLVLQLRLKRMTVLAIAVAVVSLQLISLVFPAWLEQTQIAAGSKTAITQFMNRDDSFGHFVIGLRVQNVLAPEGLAPMLLPLNPLSSLPTPVALVVRLSWLAGVLLLAWLARHLVRMARTPAHADRPALA